MIGPGASTPALGFRAELPMALLFICAESSGAKLIASFAQGTTTQRHVYVMCTVL